MFVQAFDSHLRVTIPLTDWNSRPRTEQDKLQSLALRHWISGREEVLIFARRDWWQARAFFPDLKNRLGRTFDNL